MNDTINNLSPLDGRYQKKTQKSRANFSEKALIKYRILVEIEYFISLTEIQVPNLKKWDPKMNKSIRDIYRNFNDNDAIEIKNIEKNNLFDNLNGQNPPELDEQFKNSIEARILAESEPRLAVIRRSFDETRKNFRTSIRIDEIRRLSTFFSLSVSDGGSRVAIIDCADDLNVNAANALLKTLEEPPQNTVFLLISHNPESLLPTVKSRCRELRLQKLSKQNLFSALKQINVSIPENDNEIYSLLGGGSVGNSIRLLRYDGADIYRCILSFLSQLPNLDGFELEQFVATFLGTKNRGRLELLIELLNLAVARVSKSGVLGLSLTDKMLEDEKSIFQKLCPTPNIAKKMGRTSANSIKKFKSWSLSQP